MKFIFLDIDGVINPFTREHGSSTDFDKDCVEHLAVILDTFPDARCVLSSDWRHSFTPEDINKMLRDTGVFFSVDPVVSATPWLEIIDKDFPPDHRDREIAQYINTHDIDPEDCVALEDSWPITCIPCVMCDPKIGLTSENVKEACEYLAGERKYYEKLLPEADF